MYILKLKPALKSTIWGGTKLITDFKMKTDLQNVAEAWVLSTHKDGESVVLNGKYEGKTLSNAISLFGKECLGKRGEQFPYFPILIKLIDARDDLSVQVHPSDDYALKVEGEFGKTEMWYIVDCDEGATLYYGLKSEISKKEFEDSIADNTVTEHLNKVTVKKGDVYFIPAGTIHAIGKGILIAEIQQNSNTTYRVSDYGRLGADGKPRQLHIEKAAEVSELRPQNTEQGLKKGYLAYCKYFNVKLIQVADTAEICVDDESFSSLLCVEGSAQINDLTLNKGECAFIPANFGKVEIKGKATLIESRV